MQNLIRSSSYPSKRSLVQLKNKWRYFNDMTYNTLFLVTEEMLPCNAYMRHTAMLTAHSQQAMKSLLWSVL